MLPYITNWIWGSPSDNSGSTEEGVLPQGATKAFKSMASEEEWVFIEQTDKDLPHTETLQSLSSGHSSDGDDSWVVAPPACLTRKDSLSEMGSLENLLIEHPSMSVYRGRTEDAESGKGEDLVLERRCLLEGRQTPRPSELTKVTPSHRSVISKGKSTKRNFISSSNKQREVRPKIPKLSRKALNRHNAHSARQIPPNRRQFRLFQPKNH